MFTLLRSLVSCLLLVVLGVGCSVFRGPFKPTLPNTERSTPERSITELRAEIAELGKTIGGYPTKLQDDSEKYETYERWSEALADARAYEQHEGTSERVLKMLSDLYRQGHNLNVEGAGTLAIETIDYCLQKFPKSVSCNQSALYFYLSVAPTVVHLERAERSLQALRARLGTKASEEVEEAAVFLYAYQRRPDDTLKQIERYKRLFPRSPKKASFATIATAMKKGDAFYPTADLPGPTGAWR